MTVSAPGSTLGDTPGPIQIKQAFSDIVVAHSDVPLNRLAADKPLIMNASTKANIKATLTASSNRKLLAAQLCSLGLFAQPDSLSDMGRMARQTRNLLSNVTLQTTTSKKPTF